MMSCQNNPAGNEDLKTDSIPDAPRDREVTDEQQEDASLLLPPKEDASLLHPKTENSVNEGNKSSPKSDDKTYLKPPKDASFTTKKKSSPKSIPKSPKNKKEKKKFPEPSNVVYQISHSNGIHIGPDYNVTILQNSSSSKSRAAPRKSSAIEVLLDSVKPVTRDHIRVVAPHVGEHWREVGRTLNLTDGRLEQIDLDYHKEGMKEVVYQVLLDWSRANASEAKVGDLTNALWKSAEYSAVKKLAEWCRGNDQL